MIIYTEQEKRRHRKDFLSIVSLKVLFLYSHLSNVIIPMLEVSQYRHAQDCHGLAYTVHFWGPVDKYTRDNGAFENGTHIVSTSHALWPKGKQIADVMSRYMTCKESTRRRNLNLSQVIVLRLAKYLLYNAHVINQVISVEHLLLEDNLKD